MSKLKDLLIGSREQIVEQWLQATLESYPKDSGAFYSREKDPFANPVGQTLAQNLPTVFDGIVGTQSRDDRISALAEIIRIRAIQEFSPAEAVGFVFKLKQIIKDEVVRSRSKDDSSTELEAFLIQIDAAALDAFNAYTECREKLAQVRINEVKRQVSRVFRRRGLIDEDLDLDPKR